jgi:hypothetical protein
MGKEAHAEDIKRKKVGKERKTASRTTTTTLLKILFSKFTTSLHLLEELWNFR